MKKEICLSCLTVCTIMLACSTPSDKSVRSAASVIPVDLEHAGALQASQWFDTIMYVPLETSDSFLFSNISHLKVSHILYPTSPFFCLTDIPEKAN
ncbi:6-bladed beta-propeller [Phocaeicola coprophilus]|uniref:6-bladed beta-propeller n=1 Tax=Phocaeicola coprophilus TaxID=387090 RepID=UPI004024F23F